MLKDLELKIHEEAKSLAKHYEQTQRDLIRVLAEVDEHKIFLKLGYESLYAYALSELKLSESNAASFIQVSRKATEVPELKCALDHGLSVHKARRIAPLLGNDLPREEVNHWIEKAQNLSKRDLEREVATQFPERFTPTTYGYVSSDRLELRVGLAEEIFQRLLQIQDLLSSKEKKHVSVEEMLDLMSKDFVKRYDPIEREKSREERLAKRRERAETLRNEVPRDFDEEFVMSKPVQERGDERSQDMVQLESPANLPGLGHVPFASDLKPGQKISSFLESMREAVREELPDRRAREVISRDRRRCRFVHPNGHRCKQQRWLHIHHILPRSQGGGDHIENLVTLCSAHHRFIHWKMKESVPFDQSAFDGQAALPI